MNIPLDLAAAIASLPEDPRFTSLGDWVERHGDAWSFQFRASLSVAATDHMPARSDWHLVATGEPTDRIVRIYPDVDGGIVATFPHQDFNDPPVEGLLWRTGKPCLDRPSSTFQRHDWGGEPHDLAERLVWHIGRLLLWIDAAAQNQLMVPGDPLELPMYPTGDVTSVLGFSEKAEDLIWWTGLDQQWGFASISEVPGARATAVISNFMDPQRRSIRKVDWSIAIPVDANRVDAVWLTLPALAVFEPWRTAATWAELAALCAGASVDLPAILADAGSRLRRIQRPKHASPVHLLIGFPLEEIVGDPAQRFHWIAVANMQLCKRDDVRRGFYSTASARRAWDVDFAKSNRPLEWRRSANWAPDQLRRRGEAEDDVRGKTVLILGCGTLGALVAENLLRMGVTRMGLVDYDTIQVGNLSRHSLTMEDAGLNKAARLSKRLNLAAPDARVTPLPFNFPPWESADVEALQGWDVVVDCTASDTVLRDMARFDWRTERVFISLAMTWQAKGLFAFTASETAFPAIDAIERFSAVSTTPDTGAKGAMEGIGCWHPVFPATADDVNLWGAIGSKFVRRAILERKKQASLYLQREDGSVDRRDA